MAADVSFYRRLFKAVTQFKKNPAQNRAVVEDDGRYYQIWKKPTLKLFRTFQPFYRRGDFADDNNLVQYIFDGVKRQRKEFLQMASEETPETISHEAQEEIHAADEALAHHEITSKQHQQKHEQIAHKHEQLHAQKPQEPNQPPQEQAAVAVAEREPGPSSPAPPFTPEEQQQLEALRNRPDVQARRETISLPPEPPPQIRFAPAPPPQSPINLGPIRDNVATIRSFSPPSIPAPVEIGINRGLNNAASAGREMVSDGLRSLTGGAFRGGATQAGESIAGRLLGGSATRLVAGNALRAAAVSGPVGWSIAAIIGAVVVGLILFIIIVMLITQLEKTNALIGLETTPSMPGTTLSPGPSSINQCQFIYKGKPYSVKSTLLQSAISEVAAKTGVPAAVLAGVAMHENPGFTSGADDNHDAFAARNFSGVDCNPHFATSPTGALGLMQIQTPPNLRPQGAGSYNPNAFDANGVNIGLGFLGRTVSSLTTQDYCDVKTNLYMGAGVLISKNGGKPPEDPSQIASSVCRYYGQCTFGGGYDNNGVYQDTFNYGDEVRDSFLACNVSAPAPVLGPPPADDATLLRQAIIDKFGITMNGYDLQHLKWAWEKFSAISRTKFLALTRGTVVTAGAGSVQTGCNTVIVDQYPQEVFNIVLIHEMGHIIKNCASANDSFVDEYFRVLAKEGPITNYAATACTGGTNTESEDYPEMVTYYLNPGSDSQTASCARRGPNPFANGGKPLHRQLVEKVLGKL